VFRLRDERRSRTSTNKDVTARLGALRQLIDAVLPEKKK